MSNYLAIAAVTATLYDILSQNAQDAVAGARVTMDRPSDMENDRSGRPRINLYLYQVTHNAALRNADLPTRRSNGGFAHTPQAAMNLQYLLTFLATRPSLCLSDCWAKRSVLCILILYSPGKRSTERSGGWSTPVRNT